MTAEGKQNLDTGVSICEDEAICTNFFRCFATTFSIRLFSTDTNICVQLSCFDKEIVQCLC